MPEGGSKLRAAYRTSLRRRTGRGGAGNMTACSGNHFSANRTYLIFRTRCIGAKRMTLCGNALRTFFITAGTRRSLYAFFRTSRSLCLHILTPIMPEGGNFLLRLDDRVTAAAMDAFGFPRSRTRCRYRLIDDFYMAESFDIPRLRFPATRTFGYLNAFLSTGGGLRLRVFAPIMPERGDDFLRRQYFLATAAMAALRETRVGTGRRNGLIRHRRVSQGLNVAVTGRIAAQAFRRLDAVLRTSGSFRLNVCAPAMAKRGDLLLYLNDRIATRAMRTVRKARIRTGRRNGGIDHGRVTQCRHRS